MNDVLEWDIRVPLVFNAYVLVDVLIALLLVSGGFVAVFLWVTGFTDVYGVIRLFLIADGLLIVLIYGVMGLVFLNRFQLLYRLDDTGMHVRVGEFESSFNRIAWIITNFVQRHGISGGRASALMSEEQHISWSRVTRAYYDERKRVATLSDDLRPLMRVYCTSENVDVVFNAIQGFVPEPEE